MKNNLIFAIFCGIYPVQKRKKTRYNERELNYELNTGF